MGSAGMASTWKQKLSYGGLNPQNCSIGLCSDFCPQWCPPIPPIPPYNYPPPAPLFHHESSLPRFFSPLDLIVAGVLIGAFIRIIIFAIRCCRNRNATARTDDPSHGAGGNPSNHAAAATNFGLDEKLIKSIAMFKYSKKDKIIDGTECSVCLSEFKEGESLRLLPECNHAFHATCIDAWLRSRPNCPVCRAKITFASTASHNQIHYSPQLPETSANNETSVQNHRRNDEVAAVEEDIETGGCRQHADHQTLQQVDGTKTPGSAVADLRKC